MKQTIRVALHFAFWLVIVLFWMKLQTALQWSCNRWLLFEVPSWTV